MIDAQMHRFLSKNYCELIMWKIKKYPKVSLVINSVLETVNYTAVIIMTFN